METTGLKPLTWEEMKTKLASIEEPKSLADDYKHISISEKQVLDMTGIDGGNIIQKPAAHFSS